jgi:hypothetical protein
MMMMIYHSISDAINYIVAEGECELMRYNQKNKTHAGIDWVRHPFWVSAKMLIGQNAVDQYTPECEWFGKANEKRMEQLIADRIPQLIDQFKQDYNGNYTFGHLLVRRAAFCLPESRYKDGNDELDRFRHPVYGSTFNAVIHTNDRLSFMYLQELQEQRMLIQLNEQNVIGGLYIRWNAEDPRSIYVGTSKAIPNRSHTGTGLYLWDIYGTGDIRTAENIEKKVHTYLREIGDPFLIRGRGRFRVHSGNARDLVLKFLDTYYRDFFIFHNKAYYHSEEED